MRLLSGSRLLLLGCASLAVVVVIALVVGRSSPGSPADSSKAATTPPGETATLSISGKQIRQVAGVGLPASAWAVASSVSGTWQISPSGPLPHPATVDIPLSRLSPADGLTVVFTSESPNGPWTPLATKIVRGGRYAEVTVTHLSWFTSIRISAAEALAAIQQYFDQFSGGAFNAATPPSCQDEPQARTDNYRASSSPGNTMYWCFGMEGGQRVLKTVNNRRYPLLVAHGLPLIAGSSGGDIFQLAARLLSFDGVVVYPQDEADFGATLAQGTWASLHADLGGEAQLLSSLHVGVSALFNILTRFGAKEDPTKVAKVIDTMLTVDACRAAMGSPGAILSACFSPSEIAQAFGGWGILLAPVAALTSVIDYFHGALNGFVDSFTGRTRYTAVVSHASPPVPTFADFVGKWGVHDGQLCIGQTLNLAAVAGTTNPPPCSGSGQVGWVGYWMGCSPLDPNNPVPICYQWVNLSVAYNSDGTVLATVTGAPIYTTTGLQVVAGYQSPYPWLDSNDTFQIAKVATGLLKTAWLHTAGPMGGNPYWCNYQTISASNRNLCGA